MVALPITIAMTTASCQHMDVMIVIMDNKVTKWTTCRTMCEPRTGEVGLALLQGECQSASHSVSCRVFARRKIFIGPPFLLNLVDLAMVMADQCVKKLLGRISRLLVGCKFYKGSLLHSEAHILVDLTTVQPSSISNAVH
jgi:hypothetical protein